MDINARAVPRLQQHFFWRIFGASGAHNMNICDRHITKDDEYKKKNKINSLHVPSLTLSMPTFDVSGGALDTRARHPRHLVDRLADSYPQVNWCQFGGSCEVNQYNG